MMKNKKKKKTQLINELTVSSLAFTTSYGIRYKQCGPRESSLHLIIPHHLHFPSISLATRPTVPEPHGSPYPDKHIHMWSPLVERVWQVHTSTCTYLHKGGKPSDSLKDSRVRYCITIWTLRTLFGAMLGPFNSFYVVFMVYLDEGPREFTVVCLRKCWKSVGGELLCSLLSAVYWWTFRELDTADEENTRVSYSMSEMSKEPWSLSKDSTALNLSTFKVQRNAKTVMGWSMCVAYAADFFSFYIRPFLYVS